MVVDVNTHVLTHIGGGGTNIVACKRATFWAFSDKVATKTDATTKTTGLTGNLRSISDNDKIVSSDVVTDSGSIITTEELIVDSKSPTSTAADYVKKAETQVQTVVHAISEVVGTTCKVIGEIVTLWGLLGDAEEVCEDIVETFEEILGADEDKIYLGSESLSNSIDFNSNVVIKPCIKINPAIAVSALGILTLSDGASVYDGQTLVAVGQAIKGNQITVAAIDNLTAQIHLSLPAGTIRGTATFDYQAFYDNVSIVNASDKDMVLGDVEVFNTDMPGLIVADQRKTANCFTMRSIRSWMSGRCSQHR